MGHLSTMSAHSWFMGTASMSWKLPLYRRCRLPAAASASTVPKMVSASPETTESQWRRASTGMSEAWTPPRTTGTPLAR